MRLHPQWILVVAMALIWTERGAGETFELPLKRGWNLIALPCVPADNTVTAVLAPAQVPSVWAWTGNALIPATTLEVGEGYWAFALEDVDLAITGTAITTESLALQAGWQLIGPLPPFGKPSQPEVGPLIWDWNTLGRRFDAVTSPILTQGRGYWLFMTTPASIVFEAFTISGVLTGDFVDDIEMTLSGDFTATTRSRDDGSYTFFVPAGVYQVTPATDFGAFTPPFAPGLDATISDVSNVDFGTIDGSADSSFLTPGAIGDFGSETTNFAPSANAHALAAATEPAFNRSERSLTLRHDRNTSYDIGDVYIGDTSTPAAVHATALEFSQGRAVLHTTEATLPELLATNSDFTFTATPDWTSSSQGSAGLISIEDIDPDGGISISDLTILNLEVDNDGIIDWDSSQILSQAVEPGDRERILRRGRFSAGVTNVRLLNSRIRMVPTVAFTIENDAGASNISGTVQTHVIANVEGRLSSTGASSCDLVAAYVDDLRLPLTISTSPPIHLELVLDIDMGLQLDVDSATTTSFSRATEYTISTTFDYRTDSGLTTTHTTARGYGDGAMSATGEANADVALSLLPRVRIKLYEQALNDVRYTAYARGKTTFPQLNNQPDQFVGVYGNFLLDPDSHFLANTFGRSAATLNHFQVWDMLGPRDGGQPNSNPTLTTTATTVASGAPSYLQSVTSEDADQNLLHHFLTEHPSNGNITAFEPISGDLSMVSLLAAGNDNVSLSTSDGIGNSTAMALPLTVVNTAAPKARFRWAADALNVAFDGSLSVNGAGGSDGLEIRWDYNSDRVWDTAWSATLTTTHVYPSSGSRVAIAEIRDSNGVTDQARHLVNVPEAGSNHVPIPAFTVMVNHLAIDVDASTSTDNEDSTENLQVRWDWQNDGIWDSPWSTTKTASHEYSRSGNHTIALQVLDSDENIASETMETMVSIPVAAAGEYLLIDVSGGSAAANYPVTELGSRPTDLLSNIEYRTTKILLRRIAAGTFTMGSPEGELGRDALSESAHLVTLNDDFYIGVFELSQQQWQQVMGNSPSFFGGSQGPVERPSWDEIRGGTWPGGNPAAGSFMQTLRDRTSRDADLPTEAQWEYACRAGTITALNSGVDLTATDMDAAVSRVARYWHNGGSDFTTDPTYGGSAAVGIYDVNPWGLYDMHGNVWEWCLDWYIDDLGTEAVSDPVGPATGGLRTIRGGGWTSLSANCRSASRSNFFPDGGENDIGFRVVIPIPSSR